MYLKRNLMGLKPLDRSYHQIIMYDVPEEKPDWLLVDPGDFIAFAAFIHPKVVEGRLPNRLLPSQHLQTAFTNKGILCRETKLYQSH